MKLAKLLGIIAEGYDSVEAAYNHRNGKLIKGEAGDTLAEFVVTEIGECFEPNWSDSEQIESAIELLQNAKADLQAAIDSLSKAVKPE